MTKNSKFDFQKLEVYKKASDFNSDCRSLIVIRTLDDYIKNQLGRAALSVQLNIAEGVAKFSAAHRKNFFITARGSVYECVAILDVLLSQKIITVEEYQSIVSKAEEISRILFVMIRNLGA